ncbi:hypothetical protein PhCBS80983_g00137 [Powellomyces hirtus]|uniref:COX assembly mitochondrial protein n=1 Tax=Powellomyces hirtus TaxID=109895 RepID=A0A507EIF2_9FUNG|nr:hypothetical protein PhCBS80983_g00137 [Powellomyces hirtus]
MTLPIACEEISQRFRACADRENLWGRLLGRCDYLKDELEKCLRKEVPSRSSQFMNNTFSPMFMVYYCLISTSVGKNVV